MNSMLDKIFLNLSKRFQGPYPTNADVSERPLRALTLVTRLSRVAVATKSYNLFRTIMQSEVAQEKKMEAARLALDAAYRPSLKSDPPVGDPKHVLDFLCYHVGPRVETEDRIHAISSGMRAIDSASDNPTSRSWTWRIESADELLTGFQQSPHLEAFKWWYRVLWIHYGGLDSGVRSRVDEIAMNGDDRVDLKRCRIAIEKEIERVKELDGGTSLAALEEAYSRLTAFIGHREKVRDDLLGIWTGLISFFPPVASTGSVYPVANRFPLYRTGLSARVDDFSHHPLTRYTTFEFFPLSFLFVCAWYAKSFNPIRQQPSTPVHTLSCSHRTMAVCVEYIPYFARFVYVLGSNACANGTLDISEFARLVTGTSAPAVSVERNLHPPTEGIGLFHLHSIPPLSHYRYVTHASHRVDRFDH